MTPIAATWRLLTPPAAGGVAVVQIDGDIDSVFSRINIEPVAPGRIALRSIAGIDTGLAARWSPSCLHLMPHAGVGVVREIIAKLGAAGLDESPAADTGFPEAADELEARLLHALARAASPLAIDMLLDQPRKWAAYRAGHAPGPDKGHSRRLCRLIEPPLIVMVGPANVGKSTLTNTLAGAAVSIVSELPGTTRDHVGVTVELAGLTGRLVDTPGLRVGPGSEEAEAFEIAMDLARRAELVLLCGDAGLAPPDPPAEVAHVIRVHMKADLGPAAWPADVAVSGRTGAGLESLVRSIRDRLVTPDDLADERPWRFWPGGVAGPAARP